LDCSGVVYALLGYAVHFPGVYLVQITRGTVQSIRLCAANIVTVEQLYRGLENGKYWTGDVE
jgi:hypothetical protein